MLFTASDGTRGHELYRSDGTAWPTAKLDVSPAIFPTPRDAVGHRAVDAPAGRLRLVLDRECPPGGSRIYRLRCLEPETLILGLSVFGLAGAALATTLPEVE